MSFETDLAKFKQQVDSFAIAGAVGNFHTGFSIGDDTRGAGAGVGAATPNTSEEVFTHLENSFKNLTIRGGHDVSVSGSLVGGGFVISAKQAPSGEGTGGVGPTPTGACCIGASCSILTAADCATMGGTYQGDGAICDPNPCAGVCCAEDGSCSITTEGDCIGTYQGDGTVCDPNPCDPCVSGTLPSTLTITVSFSYPSQSYLDANPDWIGCRIEGSSSYTITDSSTYLYPWELGVFGPCTYNYNDPNGPCTSDGPVTATPFNEADCLGSCDLSGRIGAYFTLTPEPYFDDSDSSWHVDWDLDFSCTAGCTGTPQVNHFPDSSTPVAVNDIRDAGTFTLDQDNGSSGEFHFTAMWTTP